ncbi:hypothetical protein SLS55_004400 [Diplodia seriata]|uniref:T6SS Phospholipase effector Tle1-like catalytic domain-containing protein n=1 Tax=Diplodia seriata TaxID=420778 RepID=A0ABR3CJ96_9PEZI
MLESLIAFGSSKLKVAKYFHGIGVKRKLLDKFNDGISGEGCKDLIKEVYQVVGPANTTVGASSKYLHIIQFVGALDTVKKATDPFKHDLSFNDSIKHVRHAVAFNEDRRHFLPELFDTDAMTFADGRSLVQAWFVGAHADIGGGASDDGLSLYPLQWMFLESRACGLVLEHKPERRVLQNLIDNPLTLTFPDETTVKENSESSVWGFRYSNGMEVSMHDLRTSHNHGNLQKWPRKKLEKRSVVRTSTHMVRINPGIRTTLVSSGDRRPFANGNLRGYRPRGVGKSTLLNRVFGIPMSEENEGTRGKHNIDEGFESDQHPGIIIHDSEGFQSGNRKEVAAFEASVKKRCPTADPPDERFHAVWICVEADTPRPVQTAMENVIGIISKHASTLPVFIVATKKDRFLTLQDGIESKDINALEAAEDVDPNIRAKVATILQDRQEFFKAAFRKECRDFREDRTAFTFVSKNDHQSVQALVRCTIDEIADDSIYKRLVAAQVCDVQPKIDSAIDDTVRLLGHAVRSTASPIPFTTGVVVPTVSRILCDKIIRCFGFPKISAEYVDGIMNKVVWSNLARFMLQTLSQDVVRFTGIAVLNSAAVFGAPSLVPGLPLLDTPPAARMIVKCACDLILILQCAFQSGNKFITNEDIHSATIEYKAKRRSGLGGAHESIREVVHEEINKLIPLRLSRQGAQILSGSNKLRIRATMEEIIRDNAFRKEDSGRSQTDSVESSSVLSSPRSSSEPEEIHALFDSKQVDVTATG